MPDPAPAPDPDPAPERPFHHGNLRSVLLDRAEHVVRERGTDALSLRELAREVGVSHGAPRTHFVDRRALLEALAERGFTRLADSMRSAGEAHDDYVAALRAAAGAYVEFAVVDMSLLELMFAVLGAQPTPAVRHSAERFFRTVRELIVRGIDDGAFRATDVDRMTRFVSATMQGIAAVTASWGLPDTERDALIDDAITGFLAQQSGSR